MGAHETADAVLTRMEADRLRARALELVAELDTIMHRPAEGISAEALVENTRDVFRWAGSASVILAELARG